MTKRNLRARPWPLSILMIAPEPFFTPRGTPFSEYFRIKALTELGHRVDLVTYHVGEDVELRGLQIYRILPLPGVHHVPIGPSFIKIILDFFIFFKAFFLLRKREYHCIHTHEEASFMGVVFRWLFRVPHLYDMHSDLSQQMKNFEFTSSGAIIRFFQAAEKWVLQNADFVIAICKSLGQTIDDLAPHASYSVIENSPLPYESNEVTEKSRESGRKVFQSSDKPVLLYTGTLEIYQGLHLILDAAAILKAKGIEAVFLLVGGNDSQVKKLKSLIAQADLQSMFFVTGQRPVFEMPYYLEQSTLLLSPRAKGTNTPLKIYSYMASGRVILATDLETHTQVLDSTTAYLVEPTAEKFAEGIITLLGDEKLRLELAANALEVYNAELSYQKYLDKVSDAVAQAMDNWERKRAPQVKEHYSTRLYRQKDFAENFDSDRFGSLFGKSLALKEMRTFLDMIEEPGSKKILDAGGGTGRLAIPLAQEGGQVTILDTSLEMMSIAREKARADDRDINLVCGSVVELPFEDFSFDWVLSSRVIMHVVDWEKAVREFCRISKRGVIFDFPPLFAFPALVVPLLMFKKIFHPQTQHYHVIHEQRVHRELMKQGFEVVALDKRFFLPIGLHRKINNPTVSSMLEKMFKKLQFTALLGAPVTICAIRKNSKS